MNEGEEAIRAAVEAAEEFDLSALAEEAIEEINREYALVIAGDGVLILREERDEQGRTAPRFMKMDAFNAWFRNKVCQVWNKKAEEKWYSWARVWMAAKNRRQYQGVTFAPQGAPEGIYNLWRGFSVEPEKGTWTLFGEHLYENVCQGNADLYDWVLGWFAHMVQRPAERLGTSFVLRGGYGAGKTKVGEVFGSLIHRHYYLADDPRYITGQFNAHMASCLLLQVDEGFWAGDKAAEGRLKGLITSSQQFVEKKGIDPVMMPNLVRIFISSNHDWVVPVGYGERRFAVLDIGDGKREDHEFFAALDKEMDEGGRAALLYDLLKFDLSTVNLRKVPRTAALFEQKVSSLPPEAAWWFDRLVKGTINDDHREWRTEVSKAAVLASYLRTMDQSGIRRRSDQTQLGMAIRKRLCPKAISKKIKIEENDTAASTRWVNGYVLPDLEECRRIFADLVGWEVDWKEL